MGTKRSGTNGGASLRTNLARTHQAPRSVTSLVVHAYNEAAALERLLLSSLAAADAFNEWVVLDHRSNDDTPQVLGDLAPVLEAHGIALKRLHEARDLSAKVTFAHVRTRTVKAASNPVVALMDADFILGPAFEATLEAAAAELLRHDTTTCAVNYRVPVIWDHLRTNEHGVITEHGRVWVHSPKARIMHRDRVTYWQNGKWEKFRATVPARSNTVTVPNDGSVVISANVKEPERLELRKTMTMFMEDATRGKTTRNWLDAHARGETRVMPKYKYVTESFKGAPLNLALVSL